MQVQSAFLSRPMVYSYFDHSLLITAPLRHDRYGQITFCKHPGRAAQRANASRPMPDCPAIA